MAQRDEECATVWAEIHIFEGRMYVTQLWGTTGVHVDDAASDEELGRVVAEQVGGPAVPLLRLPGAESPQGRTSWQVFCEDVVGVSVRRFRPEKSARAFIMGGEWHVDAKTQDPDAPAQAVDESEGMNGVAAAVRRLLASQQPRWPVLRRIRIMTTAAGQLVVMPSIDGYTIGPARVIGFDSEPEAIHAAVRAALTDADGDRDDADEYSAALASAGVDAQSLHGGAEVEVEELSDGTIRLIGHGTVDNKRTDDPPWLGHIDDLSAACAMAAQMTRTLPKQHLRPGTPTGSSFGYKCRWLAIHGCGMNEVVSAIALGAARIATWDEGVDAAYQHEVFVSPPTAGWVFVIGARLPFDGSTIAAVSARLEAEVQYFGTHRVSEYHEWAYAIDGRVVRRLMCEGSSGVFVQAGTATSVENELGVAAMTDEDWTVNEHTVVQVAASWSLDPTSLHLVESSSEAGVCGTLPAAR